MSSAQGLQLARTMRVSILGPLGYEPNALNLSANSLLLGNELQDRIIHARKKMTVPGFEPGSSGSQPLMLTTTLYHHDGRGSTFISSSPCVTGFLFIGKGIFRSIQKKEKKRKKQKVRHPGVEPGAKAWEASMLPIHQWRILVNATST